MKNFNENIMNSNGNNVEENSMNNVNNTEMNNEMSSMVSSKEDDMSKGIVTESMTEEVRMVHLEQYFAESSLGIISTVVMLGGKAHLEATVNGLVYISRTAYGLQKLIARNNAYTNQTSVYANASDVTGFNTMDNNVWTGGVYSVLKAGVEKSVDGTTGIIDAMNFRNNAILNSPILKPTIHSQLLENFAPVDVLRVLNVLSSKEIKFHTNRYDAWAVANEAAKNARGYYKGISQATKSDARKGMNTEADANEVIDARKAMELADFNLAQHPDHSADGLARLAFVTIYPSLFGTLQYINGDKARTLSSTKTVNDKSGLLVGCMLRIVEAISKGEVAFNEENIHNTVNRKIAGLVEVLSVDIQATAKANLVKQLTIPAEFTVNDINLWATMIGGVFANASNVFYVIVNILRDAEANAPKDIFLSYVTKKKYTSLYAIVRKCLAAAESSQIGNAVSVLSRDASLRLMTTLIVKIANNQNGTVVVELSDKSKIYFKNIEVAYGFVRIIKSFTDSTTIQEENEHSNMTFANHDWDINDIYSNWGETIELAKIITNPHTNETYINDENADEISTLSYAEQFDYSNRCVYSKEEGLFNSVGIFNNDLTSHVSELMVAYNCVIILDEEYVRNTTSFAKAGTVTSIEAMRVLMGMVGIDSEYVAHGFESLILENHEPKAHGLDKDGKIAEGNIATANTANAKTGVTNYGRAVIKSDKIKTDDVNNQMLITFLASISLSEAGWAILGSAIQSISDSYTITDYRVWDALNRFAFIEHKQFLVKYAANEFNFNCPVLEKALVAVAETALEQIKSQMNYENGDVITTNENMAIIRDVINHATVLNISDYSTFNNLNNPAEQLKSTNSGYAALIANYLIASFSDNTDNLMASSFDCIGLDYHFFPGEEKLDGAGVLFYWGSKVSEETLSVITEYHRNVNKVVSHGAGSAIKATIITIDLEADNAITHLNHIFNNDALVLEMVADLHVRFDGSMPVIAGNTTLFKEKTDGIHFEELAGEDQFKCTLYYTKDLHKIVDGMKVGRGLINNLTQEGTQWLYNHIQIGSMGLEAILAMNEILAGCHYSDEHVVKIDSLYWAKIANKFRKAYGYEANPKDLVCMLMAYPKPMMERFMTIEICVDLPADILFPSGLMAIVNRDFDGDNMGLVFGTNKTNAQATIGLVAQNATRFVCDNEVLLNKANTAFDTITTKTLLAQKNSVCDIYARVVNGSVVDGTINHEQFTELHALIVRYEAMDVKTFINTKLDTRIEDLPAFGSEVTKAISNRVGTTIAFPTNMTKKETNLFIGSIAHRYVLSLSVVEAFNAVGNVYKEVLTTLKADKNVLLCVVTGNEVYGEQNEYIIKGEKKAIDYNKTLFAVCIVKERNN